MIVILIYLPFSNAYVYVKRIFTLSHGTNGKSRGCAQSKRNKRKQVERVHFVLNSCSSPEKNLEIFTISGFFFFCPKRNFAGSSNTFTFKSKICAKL